LLLYSSFSFFYLGKSGSNTIGDIGTNDEEGMCLEINSDDAKIKTDNNLQKTTSDDNDNNDNE